MPWKYHFMASVGPVLPRAESSSPDTKPRQASRSSSCWWSPVRSCSRRVVSQAAEECSVWKRLKLCWSISWSTEKAWASGAGRHSPAPEGIWSLSCSPDRKERDCVYLIQMWRPPAFPSQGSEAVHGLRGRDGVRDQHHQCHHWGDEEPLVSSSRKHSGWDERCELCFIFISSKDILLCAF